GRTDEAGERIETGDAGEARELPAAAAGSIAEEDEEPEEAVPAPRRGPQTTPFGSVWDSQLGVPSAARSVGPVDEEDFEEPEIPEYLIAEQRRGRQPQGRGPGRGGARGGRSAYTAAIERERYGTGRSSGVNRYPDVSGRERQGGGRGPSGPSRQGSF